MTITDEQIEKAAKAIRPWAFRELSYSERMSDDYAVTRQRHAQEQARDLARAALEAVMPGEPENECDCSERAPADEYWICPDCDAEWFPEEEAHPAPEPGEVDRLREVAREAFLAFEAHWSSAGGSPEEHAKFMQHRRRFYEFYEPFRAALAEGGRDE